MGRDCLVRCGDLKHGQECGYCLDHETWALLSPTLLALVHHDRLVIHQPTCCGWCEALHFCSILQIFL